MLFGAHGQEPSKPLRVTEFDEMYCAIMDVVDAYVAKGDSETWYNKTLEFQAVLTDEIRVDGHKHDIQRYPNGSLIQLVEETKNFSSSLANPCTSFVTTWLFDRQRLKYMTGIGSELQKNIDAVLGTKDPYHFNYIHNEVARGRQSNQVQDLYKSLENSKIDVTDLDYLEQDSLDCLNKALSDIKFRQTLKCQSDARKDKVISFEEIFDQYSKLATLTGENLKRLSIRKPADS